jgi:hypothetical protein
MKSKPTVELVGRREDHRHGLGVNGRDGRLGLRRQEVEQFMLAPGLLGPRTFQSGHVSSTSGI